MNAVMLPAMALAASPSSPAVMTALGSISLNAARMQAEDSRLSGPESRDEPGQEDSCHVLVVEAPHEPGLLFRGGYAGDR